MRERTYRLPKTYLPAITQLIAEGQADLTNAPPQLRSAIGRTGQQHGLFTFTRLSLITLQKPIKIIHTTENYIIIQETPN